jgi:methyl-accepting chemotaxis protein
MTNRAVGENEPGISGGGRIMAMNCWQFMKCGNEQQCPAYPDNGRDCWHVTGTLCGGEVQGTAEEKRETCLFRCEFPEKVAKKEL